MTERGKNDDGGGEIGGTPGGGEERTEVDGGKGGRGGKPVETRDAAEEEGAEADGGERKARLLHKNKKSN